MKTGEKIRELRESKGLMQAELATILGVSDKAVSAWENETRVPRMGAIEKLAAYFNVPKGYFFDDAPASTAVAAGNRDAAFSDYAARRNWDALYDCLINRPEVNELTSLAAASSKEEVLRMIRVFRAMKGE